MAKTLKGKIVLGVGIAITVGGIILTIILYLK
jgi:hypothetical protein